LKAIEAQGLGETAHRARQKLGEIFDYAESLGYELKSAGRVNAALKPVVQIRRHAITDLVELRKMLQTIEQAPAHPITRLCSRFIALTAVRPGVAQTLPWSEIAAIDPEEPVWLIPAARMKLS